MKGCFDDRSICEEGSGVVQISSVLDRPHSHLYKESFPVVPILHVELMQHGRLQHHIETEI